MPAALNLRSNKEITMDTFIRKSMGMAGAVVAAASMLSGCAAPGAGYVPPPLGATWTMAQRSTGSYGSGEARVESTRGEMVWEGRTVVAFKSPQGTILADPALGAWVALLAPDGKLVARYEPPHGFEWPLTVGKEWKSQYKMINAAGGSVPVTSTCKVESHENIAIQAGTFKTFRLACSNSLGQNDTIWFAPDAGLFVKTSLRRAANHPAGVGTRETELVAQTFGR
jgi:hypothetical protein